MASLLRRGKTYYAQYYTGKRKHRTSLRTDCLQIAKEKLRQIESKLARGNDNPLPTRTPIEDVLTKYVEHIRTTKALKTAQTDVYYLRQAFGDICDAVKTNSRKRSIKRMKRPPKDGQDRRIKLKTIEADCFERVTTADIAEFISSHVRSRGLASKTANHYRAIIHSRFNWAMAEGGIQMPHDTNPAAKVGRYKEHAPQISFLTFPQIDEQLEALKDRPQYQAMVAMYIYAGLRREETLWLQMEDINFKAGPNGMLRIRAKEVNGEFWQPKTKKNRAVPISRALRSYLDSYAPRPSIGGWYFPSPKGVKYDPDNFSSDFRRIQKKAKLGWTCLDYRHTFGSQLAMKGESLYKVSTLMGNSPEICRRHYTALIPESLADSVDFGKIKPIKPSAPFSLAASI